MKKEFTQKDLKEIKKVAPNVGLVYLTGSWLTGVEDKDSDHDFYVFSIPTKKELLTLNTGKGDQEKLSMGDVKLFYTSHLYSLINKPNPVISELFFKRPVYVSDEAKAVGEYLYVHRNATPQVNSRKFLKACMGMMYRDIKHMKANNYGPGNAGTFGKSYYGFDKAYRYAKAIMSGSDFESEVLLYGNQLAEAKRKKHITSDEVNVDELQGKIDEIQDFLDEHFYTDNSTMFLDGLVNCLPIYQGEYKSNQLFQQ